MKSWTAREWILAASVGVNLVLISFLAGVGAHQLATPGPVAPPRGEFAGPFQPRMLIESLPIEEQERARSVFRREGARSIALLRAVENARTDLETAMLAEEYDAEAVTDALEQLTEAEARLSRRSNAIMAQVLSNLTFEQRTRLGERLSQRGPGGPGARRGGDRPGFGSDDGPRFDGERRQFRPPTPDEFEPDPE